MPNPDTNELKAIRASGVAHAIDATSHGALDELSRFRPGADTRVAGASSENEDDTATDHSLAAGLVHAGWSGAFAFVWLDYCGTWTSRAGRARQSDLVKLLEHRMLSSPNAVVAGNLK